MSLPTDTHGVERHASRLLLKGTCRLIFEGQTFVPDDNADRRYWLEINECIKEQLIDRLGPSGWMYEFDAFHAEFWGTEQWTGSGFGHLGVFGGIVHIDKLVSVGFTKSEPVKSPYRSIRERLLSRRRSLF